MKKTIFAVVLTLCALAGPVCAARWKPVSVLPERTIYIDMDALARSGNVVQAWDWQKFGTGQTSASWEGTYFWVKSLTNYHCERRTTDAVLKVYFGKDGVEIKRTQLEGLQFPAAVEPDSLREKMLMTACNPPKPDLKPIAVATPEPKPAEVKPPEPTKADVQAPKDKSGAKDDPAKKTDAKAAKPDDKAVAAKKDGPVVANAKTAAANTAKRVERSPYARSARYASKKKSAGGLRLAKAGKRDDPTCPPGSVTGQSPAPLRPQFTDAGNDGMFN